jgi:hypothetical protein
MRAVLCNTAVFFLLLAGTDGWGGDIGGQGPLRLLTPGALHTILLSGTHIMMESSAIEQFLSELDGHPPDWATIYGHGHQDPDHDERLFTLNRERDAKREGRAALSWPVAFAWVGALSRYDSQVGGFPVALGPKFLKTGWGMVRFKPEEAPGNLSVIADSVQREQLQRQLENGETVEIDVVMTGKLVPEESILYDFSHDEEGLGLIMPFVRVEQVDFIMTLEGDSNRS